MVEERVDDVAVFGFAAPIIVFKVWPPVWTTKPHLAGSQVFRTLCKVGALEYPLQPSHAEACGNRAKPAITRRASGNRPGHNSPGQAETSVLRDAHEHEVNVR